MNRAQFPYDYIPDKDVGRPLFNAELYFGIPDLDPEIPANQIDVYGKQEDGTSVLLPQPIETGAGGVPLYNGSPIELLVDELFYSFKALSRNGSQIYYAENVAAVLTADAIPGILENAVTSVNYLSDLAAISPAFDGQRYSVTNSSSTSDSGYSEYVYRLASTYPADGEFIIDAPSSGQFWRLSGGYDIDVTFTVGTSERFTTLNDALVFASAYKPVAGKVIELRLKTGFVLAEQVLFENTDFRHVLITSADPIVTVARSAITQTWRGIIPTFGFAKCFAPIISVQFEMDTSGSDLSQYGIVLRSGFLRSEFGAGFRNAPLRNVECAWGSILDIRYGDFSGAGDTCIRISNGSICYARQCKANNSGGTGLSVSNAWCDFTDGEATGNFYAGVVPNGGGTVIINNATITGNVTSLSDSHGDLTTDTDGKAIGYGATLGNANSHSVYCNTGEVSIYQLVANSTNTVRPNLYAINAGVIRAPLATITGGAISAQATNSEIHIPACTMTNPSSGQAIFTSGGLVNANNSTTVTTGNTANSVFSATSAGEIRLANATCNDAPIQLFRFLRGSHLKAPGFTGTDSTINSGQLARFDASRGDLSNSDLSGRVGGIGILADLGSIVNITTTNVLLSTAVPSINDITIARGSTIFAHDSSGGLSTTANTVTAAGIIYDN